MKSPYILCLCGTAVLLFTACPAYEQQGSLYPAQQAPLSTAPSPIWSASNGSRTLDAGDTTPANAPAMREKMEHIRQTERQRRMIADTERLLTLATQLKSEMDKAAKETPSPDAIKKTEEIEKLAHSVKERMKG